MSLAQYLALGKSIENVSDEARYRVTDGAMPKFGAGKTPAERKNEQNLEICNLLDQQQMPPAEPVAAPILEAPKAEPVSNTRPARAGRWILGSKIRRTAARNESVAVQRELALDAVRPLRNDLSDSDLEAVPVEVESASAGRMATDSRPFWVRWPASLVKWLWQR